MGVLSLIHCHIVQACMFQACGPNAATTIPTACATYRSAEFTRNPFEVGFDAAVLHVPAVPFGRNTGFEFSPTLDLTKSSLRCTEPATSNALGVIFKKICKSQVVTCLVFA